MYGFEAISANNGWAISILGISIVFTGLVLLSFTIAQLHKVLNLWEDRAAVKERILEKISRGRKAGIGASDLTQCGIGADIEEIACNFERLVKLTGEPYPLPRLLKLAISCGLASPHASLNSLIEAGYIVSEGSGYYLWKKPGQDSSAPEKR